MPTPSARLASALLLTALTVHGCAGKPATDEPATLPMEAKEADPIASPAGPGALAPSLTAGAAGDILLTWLEPSADGAEHTLFLSHFADGAWTPASEITSGEGFFANWADLPAVSEAADGTRYAHWLRKLGADTYAYGVELAASSDGGVSWRELGLLHDDTSPTEHGFVSYAALADGGVQAFWLDGRAMPSGAGMQLRTARLGDGAAPPSEILDEMVCECCSTDAALTARGPLVVYRDRSETEIRDIAVVRAVDDGWSDPAMIYDDGWEIHGCPVNGPAVAADGDMAAVAWFSAARAQARVAVAFSSDAGASFSEPVMIDEAKPIGRVDIVLEPGGAALVSWMGTTGDGAEIRWIRVPADGERGPVQTVAATNPSRSAGVPRMVRAGDDLIFAWIEAGEPQSLRTGRVSIPAI